jgi:hypothetical protein
MEAGPEDPDAQVRRRRHLVSQVLVAGLIAVAYAEPVDVVHTALQKHGVSIQSLALFVVYFLTALRFFIGDILHLDEDELTARDDAGAEVKWFYDLSFIVLECVTLIFLGNVTSLEENAASRVSFFDLFALLLVVDLIWISSIAILNLQSTRQPASRFWRLWRRSEVPYGWAGLNGGLLLIVWGLGFLSDGTPPAGKLWVLVGLSVIAFVIDVFVFNYYLAKRDSDVAG